MSLRALSKIVSSFSTQRYARPCLWHLSRRPVVHVARPLMHVTHPSGHVLQPALHMARPPVHVARVLYCSKGNEGDDKSPENKAAVDSVTSSVSPDQAAIDSVTSSVSPDKPAIDSVTSSVSPDKPAIDSVTSSVSPDKAAIDSVTSSVSPDKPAIDSVTSSVSPDKAAIDSVTSSVSPDKPAIDSVTSSVSPDKTAIGTFIRLVSPDKAVIDSVTSSVSPDKPAIDTFISEAESVSLDLAQPGKLRERQKKKEKEQRWKVQREELVRKRVGEIETTVHEIAHLFGGRESVVGDLMTKIKHLGKQKARWSPESEILSAEEAVSLDSVNRHAERMRVPEAVVAKLIGKGGENIKRMEGRTGCYIDIVKQQEPGEWTEVELRGSAEQIQAARESVQGFLTINQLFCDASDRMRVPQGAIGALLGRGGENIQQLQERTGCSIKILKQQEPGEWTEVELQGSAEQIQAARESVQESITNIQEFCEASERMRVPEGVAAKLIGKGGENIERMRGRTGCYIYIAKQKEPGEWREVELRGSAEQIQAARESVQEILTTNQQFCDASDRMRVPQGAIGALLGRGGENIQQLQERTGCSIKILKQQEPGEWTEVELQGSAEQIQAARESVQESITNIQEFCEASERMRVPKGVVAKLIGKGGDNIKRMEGRTGCYIDIIKQQEPGEWMEVELRGSAEQIQAARESVQEFLTTIQQFYERMRVPEAVVAKLIGKGGENIERMRGRTGCYINIVKQQEPGEWREAELRGSAEQIQAARESVQEFLTTNQQFSEASERMRVPKGVVAKLIGKGGETIKRMEGRTGCHIEIIKQQEPGEWREVELRGSAEQIQAARESVQEFLTTNQQFSEAAERMREPQGAMGALFDRGGENIQQLQDIKIAQEMGEEVVEVSLTGTPEEVQFDRHMVESFLLDNKQSGSLRVPRNTIASIIGRGGETIKDFQRRSGCQITIPPGDMKDHVDVKMVGSAQQVEEATALIRAFLSKYHSNEAVPSHETIGEMGSREEFPAVTFGPDRLFIFNPEEYTPPAPREKGLFDQLEEQELQALSSHPPLSGFDDQIQLTREGKLWSFPIDNEQDVVRNPLESFADHVFLDERIEEFPNIPSIRHFMELVCVGLSKNPHMTVREKNGHIDWFKRYFSDKLDHFSDVYEGDADVTETSTSPSAEQ